MFIYQQAPILLECKHFETSEVSNQWETLNKVILGFPLINSFPQTQSCTWHAVNTEMTHTMQSMISGWQSTPSSCNWLTLHELPWLCLLVNYHLFHRTATGTFWLLCYHRQQSTKHTFPWLNEPMGSGRSVFLEKLGHGKHSIDNKLPNSCFLVLHLDDSSATSSCQYLLPGLLPQPQLLLPPHWHTRSPRSGHKFFQNADEGLFWWSSG